MIKKEHKEVGAVKLKVYLQHLAACGMPLVVLSFLFLVLTQALLVATNVCISNWASDSTTFVNNKMPNSTMVRTVIIVYIYFLQGQF